MVVLMDGLRVRALSIRSNVTKHLKYVRYSVLLRFFLGFSRR